jgi:hypothetical protein
MEVEKSESSKQTAIKILERIDRRLQGYMTDVDSIPYSKVNGHIRADQGSNIRSKSSKDVHWMQNITEK